MVSPVLCRINLNLPSAWKDIKDSDLMRLCELMSENCSSYLIVAKMIQRFTKMKYIGGGNLRQGKILFALNVDQWIALYNSMYWITEIPDYPVHVSIIFGRSSIDPFLMDVPFKTYLMIDNLFQRILSSTEDSSAATDLFGILYPKKWYQFQNYIQGREITAMILWISSLKKFFAAHFHELFAPTLGTASEVNMEQIMNGQIRALTGGDVTKEKEVLSMDTWRALTELNEKAKEARELNDRMRK